MSLLTFLIILETHFWIRQISRSIRNKLQCTIWLHFFKWLPLLKLSLTFKLIAKGVETSLWSLDSWLWYWPIQSTNSYITVISKDYFKWSFMKKIVTCFQNCHRGYGYVPVIYQLVKPQRDFILLFASMFSMLNSLRNDFFYKMDSHLKLCFSCIFFLIWHKNSLLKMWKCSTRRS